MIKFEEVVDGLNAELGLDLVIDKNHAVKMILDGKLTIQLEMHAKKDAYCIVCPIEQLHQGPHRETILKSALKSNHTFRPKGGHFGYVEKRGYLLLFCYIPLAIATVDEILAQMIALSKQARLWLDALQSGLPAPQGAYEDSMLPQQPGPHIPFNPFNKS